MAQDVPQVDVQSAPLGGLQPTYSNDSANITHPVNSPFPPIPPKTEAADFRRFAKNF